MDAETRTVWVLLGWSGTCPSDSHDWLEAVFATKDLADAFVAARPTPYGSLAWDGNACDGWTIEEREVLNTLSVRASSSEGNG